MNPTFYKQPTQSKLEIIKMKVAQMNEQREQESFKYPISLDDKSQRRSVLQSNQKLRRPLVSQQDSQTSSRQVESK